MTVPLAPTEGQRSGEWTAALGPSGGLAGRNVPLNQGSPVALRPQQGGFRRSIVAGSNDWNEGSGRGQRRERSFCTASSIRVSSSCRVRVTRSGSRVSEVTGQSAVTVAAVSWP